MMIGLGGPGTGEAMTPKAAEERAQAVCCGVYGDPAYGWKPEAHEYKRQLIEKYLNEKPEERRMCAVEGCQFAASFGEGGTLCYRHYRAKKDRDGSSKPTAGEGRDRVTPKSAINSPAPSSQEVA